MRAGLPLWAGDGEELPARPFLLPGGGLGQDVGSAGLWVGAVLVL